MTATSWRKSSRSSASGPDQNCVEARAALTGFQLRDSKLGEASPIFDLARAEFTAFVSATRR